MSATQVKSKFHENQKSLRKSEFSRFFRKLKPRIFFVNLNAKNTTFSRIFIPEKESQFFRQIKVVNNLAENLNIFTNFSNRKI